MLTWPIYVCWHDLYTYVDMTYIHMLTWPIYICGAVKTCLDVKLFRGKYWCCNTLSTTLNYGSSESEGSKWNISPHLTDSVEIDQFQLEDFLEEACFVVGCKHINILSTIGVVWNSGERPVVILPYMARGDLCSLLKRPEVVSWCFVLVFEFFKQWEEK